MARKKPEALREMKNEELERVLDRLGSPPEPQTEPLLREHGELPLQLLVLHLPQGFGLLARH